MQVKVRLFAAARDAVGGAPEVLELSEGATVGDARRRLRELFPGHAELLDCCACALNCKFARADQPLREGDELAVLPPVSGG